MALCLILLLPFPTTPSPPCVILSVCHWPPLPHPPLLLLPLFLSLPSVLPVCLSWQPIMKFINDQYEAYLQEEININRKKRIPDSRVHCCIYFIPPTGHWWEPPGRYHQCCATLTIQTLMLPSTYSTATMLYYPNIHKAVNSRSIHYHHYTHTTTNTMLNHANIQTAVHASSGG